MNLKLILPLIIVLFFVSCSQQIDVEAKLYSNLETQFDKKDINLSKELNSLEHLLIKEGLLKDKSWHSRENYFKFAFKNDSFPQLTNEDALFRIFESPLNFQPLSIAVRQYVKHKENDFLKSKFSAILNQLESNHIEERSNPSEVANSILLNLDSTDFKKPFYRALTLILIVHSMSDDFESNDVVMKNEEDFVRINGFPSSHSMGCGLIERRNYMSIALNNKKQIMVRRELLNNIDDLSTLLTKYTTFNRELTKAGAAIEVGNANYEGYDYPFYSYITKKEMNDAWHRSVKDYEAYLRTPGVTQDLLDFKWIVLCKWLEKKNVFELYGREILPEIHFQSSIEIETSENTDPNLLEKVYKEIYESIYGLRNEIGQKLFNESYEEINTRQNIFLNDFRKLHLLEILFPIRIIENPDQFYPEILPAPYP